MTGSPAANTSAPWSFRSRPCRAEPGHRRLPGVHRVEMVVHPSSPVRRIRAIREPGVSDSGPGEVESDVLTWPCTDRAGRCPGSRTPQWSARAHSARPAPSSQVAARAARQCVARPIRDFYSECRRGVSGPDAGSGRL